jgi:hypothetical protein
VFKFACEKQCGQVDPIEMGHCFGSNAKVMQILQCCNDAMLRRRRRHERDEESPAFAGLSGDFDSALIRMPSAIRGGLST